LHHIWGRYPIISRQFLTAKTTGLLVGQSQTRLHWQASLEPVTSATPAPCNASIWTPSTTPSYHFMSFLAATSFSNAVINTSGAHRSAGPFRIRFGSDWRNNGVMDWHHCLGPRPTKINTFQLRRERSNALKHQYVVLIVSDDSELRLDRRGDETNPVDAMTSEGGESIDTICGC
jgi:hypothetical protein